MTPTAFHVTSEDLKSLLPAAAVGALRDVLVAEAKLLGIPLTGVNVPASITTRDGGVDADVTCPIQPSGHNGVLRFGYTCYQVKTGEFSLSSLRDIKSILLRPSVKKTKRAVTPADLNDRVKDCLDRKGTLVIVLFGAEAVDRKPNATADAFRNFLARIDERYRSASIEIWRLNQVVTFVSNVTGLALRLKGLGSIVPFAHDHAWLGQCSNFEGAEYLLSEKHSSTLELIRTTIRQQAALRNIRVIGEAGCGKTRLVYEALNQEDIAPLVVYCEDGDQVLESGTVEALRQLAVHMPMVLVVDECNAVARSGIQQRMRANPKDLTLITIHNEEDIQDRSEPDLLLIDAPKLPGEQIARVLGSYEVPADQAKAVAPLCDGSPRVAHIVGASMRQEKGAATLVTPATMRVVWQRYVAGREGRDHPNFRLRALVITCVALFKKFGWEGVYKKEGTLIWEKLVHRIEPGLSYDGFRAEVESFRSRRLLQGKSTLYITPRLLHIKLWCDWWDMYADTLDVTDLISSLSEQLRTWMQEMFIYARESAAATEVVNRLLDPQGPYATIKGFETESGASFFFALAQVNPGAAVRRLSDALGSMSTEERRQFGPGRRAVIHSLEHIAVFEEFFLEAAGCLLLLAEAENETWANNATGIFSELFSLGYGKLAATQLPPSERLPYLLQLLGSPVDGRRALALRAFDEALDTQMTRVDIGDMHGLRPLPERWTPKTYGELYGAYREHFEALYARIPRLADKDAREAVAIILRRARSLVQMKTLAERMPTVLAEIAQRDQESATEVLETVVSILHYERDHPDPAFMSKMRELYDSLVNTSFSTKLRRYAAMDLIEDKFNEAGEHEDQAAIALKELAVEVVANPSLLTPELKWLHSSEAKNGYTFGRELGLADHDQSLWNLVKDAWVASSTRTDFFIGGFLSGIFSRDPSAWEKELNAIAHDDALVSHFPVLLWRSGMSPAMASLLLAMVRQARVDPIVLRMFVYGAVTRGMPRETVRELIEELLAGGDRKHVEAAIDVLASVLREDSAPSAAILDLCYRALSHDALFAASESGRVDTMIDFHWNGLAKLFLKSDPSKALMLAELVIRQFGRAGTIFGEYQPQSLEFLENVVESFPAETWRAVADCLVPPLNERAWDLLRWMRGSEHRRGKSVVPAFERFPKDAILDWVSADPKKRAIVIAHFVPPTIADAGFKDTMAYAILDKYGHLREVRSAFHANFNTGSWWGPASQHFRQKRSQLEVAQSAETNTNIKRWFEEQIAGLDEMIRQEEAREEREELGR
ncbi:MAG TPA: hypothetical protein VGR71_15525 [Nitrospira sp.]|nr:hypothetical protein [Nitrospira sp.]